MKVRKWPKKLTRKYLRVASMYRRFAGRSIHYDFSLEMLLECYEHESNGLKPSKQNGYVFGKWAKDISVVTWIEDIKKGDACKAEFIFGIDSWWAEPALRNVIVPIWFPYRLDEQMEIFDQRFLPELPQHVHIRKRRNGFVPEDAKIEVISWPKL